MNIFPKVTQPWFALTEISFSFLSGNPTLESPIITKAAFHKYVSRGNNPVRTRGICERRLLVNLNIGWSQLYFE